MLINNYLFRILDDRKTPTKWYGVILDGTPKNLFEILSDYVDPYCCKLSKLETQFAFSFNPTRKLMQLDKKDEILLEDAKWIIPNWSTHEQPILLNYDDFF